MKISIESAAASYLNKINAEMKSKQSAPLQETGRNFDQLVISSNSTQIAEERLEAAAKKDVAGTVFQTASDDKIADLRAQVSQGLYKVDPEAVAAKILFWGGDQ